MLLQQGEEFLLEAHSLVMLFLILDVTRDNGGEGGAHAKRRVALLLVELLALAVRPARGVRFDC